MNAKAKITLSPEQETLLISLYAKSQPGNPLVAMLLLLRYERWSVRRGYRAWINLAWG